MGDTSGLTLGHRLREARQRSFVGRETERALFRSALAAQERTFSVLYLYGPGGVGKTALLRRLSDDAREAGRVVVWVDARMISPNPPTFEAEAAGALDMARVVLVIDTFEQCQGLESWLRTRFLPLLPYDAVVVIAGRLPPDPRWRTDPDWNDALRVITLPALTVEESRSLLVVKDVPAHLHSELLAFAGGLPLALTLASDVVRSETSELVAWTPDRRVVETLLAQLIGEVPTGEHRRALEVCALVEVTTEDLLHHAVGDHTESLFAWLRALPFIESSERGLFPHDVVRDALTADLRWRDPHGFETLHQGIHDLLLDRIRAAPDPDVMRATRSLLFLYRNASGVAGYVTWSEQGEVYEDAYRPEHRADVLRLAAECDGPESAAIVEFWLDRQPRGFHVQRQTETGEVVAFCAWLALEKPCAEEITRDPVVAAVWDHSRVHGPTRQGEHIAVSRFAVDPAAGGRTSPAMDLMVARATAEWLRGERVAWSFMVTPGVEFWKPQMEVVEHALVPVDLRIGDRDYGLFGHDWRAVPVSKWLARLNAEVISGRLPSIDQQDVVLPRVEFNEAVRAALRDLGRNDLLTANILCSTRLASDGGQIRELLTDAVQALADAPGGLKPHRALHATYFLRAPSQEAAAERLGLPFSTYRRHLVTGIAQVCEWLWNRELSAR
jgi:AAA ATPase domain